MKILWFTNNLLPDIAKKHGIKSSVNEGWLIGMSTSLTQNFKDISLGIACSQNFSEKLVEGSLQNYEYFAYYEQSKEFYNPSLRVEIENIIKKYDPDIIHVMGSEYPHTLSVMEASERLNVLDRTVISIQGLIYFIGNHLREFAWNSYKVKNSLRDILKKQGIREFSRAYDRRGEYEVKAFEKCKHVIGRTEWDKGCAYILNPNIQYHFNNEILRPEFYEKKWDYGECEKKSIFFSQVSNPIKGFDSMLKALCIIKKRYPEVKLYAAGSDVFLKQENTPYWKRTGFINYIFELIKKLDLSRNVVFYGSLNAIQMRDAYLRANVFVCSSLIENSPNSVGEAMILGAPTITSHVGGVADMMIHEREGFIYPQDEDYMLAYYVERLFEDVGLAQSISKRAIIRAEETHSREKNSKDLYEIYKVMYLNEVDR